MSNLDLWEKYRSVPNNALKDFDNGNFKGTDINTMWRMKCLTEEYGVCGIGWYYDIIRTWNVNIPIEQGGDILTFAEIKLYIKQDNEWSKGITGVGGNKMLSYIKSRESFKASDEAIKMAVTDAIGNACRNLGFGADVYWANDKTKYTENTIEKTPQTSTKPQNTTTYPTKTQTPEKTSENQLKCTRCNADITEKVAKYSKDVYGVELCYSCQKKVGVPAVQEIEVNEQSTMPIDINTDGLPF